MEGIDELKLKDDLSEKESTLKLICKLLLNKKEDLNNVIRKTPDLKMNNIKNTIQEFYHIGSCSILVATLSYNVNLTDRYLKNNLEMEFHLFAAIWIA